MRRKPITKRIRFEVYKRDGFTCQYCGKSAPDVVLHIDHIEPVSKGGSNDFINLVTSCLDCNLGKGARRISDTSVVQKQKKQIKELQSKTEQLEMMVAWHKDLCSLNTKTSQTIADYWKGKMGGHYHLNQTGMRDIEKMVKKFSVKEILEAVDAACEKLEFEDGSDKPTIDSANGTLSLVSKICAVNRIAQGKPYIKDLFYIRGILKNRMHINPWKAMKIMEVAYGSGVSIEDMKSVACEARNWNEWQGAMHEMVYGPEDENA